MRHLFRISFLIIIMTLTTATASADKYSRAWKKVDKLIEEDLPESAAKEINSIWDMAARDGDGRQMLKSAVYLTRVQQTYGENSTVNGIELFKTLLPKLKVREHQALCHAFLAKGYLQYKQYNDYNLRRQKPSDMPDPPIDRWTLQMITDTICYHLEQSIRLAADVTYTRNSQMGLYGMDLSQANVRGVSSGYYEEFFPGGNKAGLKLRPQLADMLLDNALITLTGQRFINSKRGFLDDSRLYGSPEDYLNAVANVGPDDPDLWPFYILKCLTMHNLGSKPSIRTTIDIRRMNLLADYLDSNSQKWDKNYDLWLKGSLALADKYEKKVKFSTQFYSVAAQMIENHIHDFDDEPERQAVMKRNAHDICMRAQKKWPKSEGALECLKLLAQIERSSINLSLERDMVPGEGTMASLTYTNTKTVYLKIVEFAGGSGYHTDEVTLLSELNRLSPVSEWSVRLNDQNDWLEHHTIVTVPPVMQGSYYLMASTGPYFNSGDCIAYEYLECNGLGLVHTVADNGALTGTTVNLKTGEPVPSCRYTVWQVNGNNEHTRIATQGFSSDDGFISIEGLRNGRYTMEIDKGENKGNCTFNIPWVSDMPDRAHAVVFTDRSTFLPGDSVHFNCVAYLSDGYDKGSVLKGVVVRATLYDANYKEVERLTLTTDSMGVARGDFMIPDNIIPGRASIRVVSDSDSDYDFSVYSYLNIESFRQPKFEIVMDRVPGEKLLDRSFEVSGKAMSLTGVPVDGALVSWTASVSSYQVHPLCIQDDRGNYRLDSGELETAADGSFRFSLKVSSGILYQESGMVTVNVMVTDVNGETHDKTLNFDVGGGQRRVVVEADNPYPNMNGEYWVNVLLLSGGRLIEGDVHVTVSRVDVPARKLPLPFNVNGKKRLDEITKCVDNLNLAERFPKYDFDFDAEPVILETVLDKTIRTSSDDYPISHHLFLKGLKSGIYRIKATSDNAEEGICDAIFVQDDDFGFVPGSEYLWCVADSRHSNSAEVGDTITLRLSSCLPDAVIYYNVKDRFGVCDRGVIRTNGKQQQLLIPVVEEMVGRIEVETGLVYEGFGRNNSALGFEVRNHRKQLDVELVTFRDLLEPDSQEEWKVRITDKQGNPVTAALMLDMYDTALDRYSYHRWTFSPWNAVYISSSDIAALPLRYANNYLPWNHAWDTKYEYKGKRAITGTLINPFEYYVRPRLARGGVMFKSANAVYAVDDAEVEEDMLASPMMMSRAAGAMDLESQQGSVGADIAFETSNESAELAPVTLRTDMNPTGLFEYLITDSAGVATVRFNAPQLLTRWKLQGIAFTDSLQTGRIERIVTTRKQIMVEPAAPRFLRQGDRMEFTVKVSNLADEAVKAKVALTFTDAVTGKSLNIIEGTQSKIISIPAGGNEGTGFIINVPAGLTAVTYLITAQTTGHSDGMQETIPVLSNRTQVVQALSLFSNGNEKRTFRFEELNKTRSNTMADEQLTLEYSASPIWYAIQALPSMIRVDDPSNLRLFHSFMGAAISENLSSRYPAIRQMLDEWAVLPASEWQTQLERNQKLTSTLLEETPWLRSSQSERDRLHSLATSLGSEETAKAMQDALQRLRDAQMGDGGWPWIDGLPSSVHITDEILQGLGLLIENGVIEVTPELKEMIQHGLDFLDSNFYKSYNVERKPESLGYSELSYLLTRSYFASYPFSASTRASHTYYARLAELQDTHDLDLWFRAQLALLLARQGKSDQAMHIAATLVERSLYSDEMGRYWRDNQGGLLWHEAPIETQSLIIRTLLATDNRTQAVEAARWLLKQRQTTGWSSSPATAAAVTALMATGGDVQLASDPDITIYVGKDAVKASDSKATAGYTTQTWDGPISRDKAEVTVDSKTPGISWGAIYRSFTDEMDKVEHSENGMSLKRTVWRVVRASDGDRLEEVKPGTRLRVGDRLKIQFDLTTDRNLEYLQLSDMRAATMEPVNTAAGYSYNWRDDIGYYAAPGNTRNVFYIDRLSKGSYRIEYEVNVQKPGRFQEGIAVMQCLYAPAFRATTTSATIIVE